MLAVVGSLGAATCWGVADFMAGVQSRRTHPLVVVFVGHTAGLICLTAIFLLTGPSALAGDGLLTAVLAGLCTAGGAAFLYAALSIGPMGVVAPISATGALVPVLVSLTAHHRPTGLQILGMVAVIIGVILAARQAPGPDGSEPNSRVGIALALVAAVFIGTSLAALDAAGNGGSGIVAVLLLARLTDVLVLAAAVTVVRRRIEMKRAPLGPLIVIGVVELGGLSLFTFSSAHGLLSVVAVLATLYPVVTLVLSFAVLGERIRRTQGIGVSLALGGVALLTRASS